MKGDVLEQGKYALQFKKKKKGASACLDMTNIRCKVTSTQNYFFYLRIIYMTDIRRKEQIHHTINVSIVTQKITVEVKLQVQ